MFIIYNYNSNKDTIKDLTKLLKINREKNQLKVLEADFVKEFLKTLENDKEDKIIKEIILMGEKYFEDSYKEALAKFKDSL